MDINRLVIKPVNVVKAKVITVNSSGKKDGLSNEAKDAILEAFEHVAWTDEHGQDYVDAIRDALYPPATLLRIQAVYTQSGTVYPTDSLDSLKPDLVVTAVYTDSSTETLTTYSLSGTLTAGQSTITVSHGGKTTTFKVNVTAPATLVSISAVYTQGNATIYDNDSLDLLKERLVVTGTYSDSTTETITGYTLSGTLTAGSSTITASYGGKTSSFTVTVDSTALPSGYTKYDYIKRKTTGNTTVPIARMIFLPDQTDMNALSMRAKIAVNVDTSTMSSNTTNPILGVRNESGFLTSYSVYFGKAGTSDQGAFGVANGVSVWYTMDAFVVGEPHTFYLRNPETSPIYGRIDNGPEYEKAWESTFVIPHGMALLSNPPYNATNNQSLSQFAQIGEIQLKKRDGECVGYYIPCTYNGVIGVYDLVTEQFYTAAQTAYTTISNSSCLYAVGNWSQS